MRAIDADALKRKAQKVATEAWKMKITGNVETVLNQFIDWIDVAPTIEPDLFNNNILRHPQCTSRTKLGNCDPVGGFCTSVPKEMCDAQEHEKYIDADLISRKAAIEAVETIGFDFSDSDLSAVELEEVCEAIGEVRQEWLQRIKRLPPAQPEIVRCKACRNRGDDDCPMRFIEWVEYDDDGYIEYDDIIHDYTKDDGFCDRAERRTDE